MIKKENKKILFLSVVIFMTGTLEMAHSINM